MTRPETLAHVIQGFGVAIAIIGAAISVPSGTAKLLGRTGEVLRSLGSRIQLLWRPIVVLFRGRKDLHDRATPASTAGMSGIGVLTLGSGRVWPAHGTADERINALHEYLLEVEGMVNALRIDLTQEAADRRQAIRDLERRAKEMVAELRQLLDEQERKSAEVDAHGLPVIAISIILTGIPTVLAAIWWIGWVALVFAIVWTVGAAWSVWAVHTGGFDQRARTGVSGER